MGQATGTDRATLSIPMARTADNALVPAEEIDTHLAGWATPLQCPDCPCQVTAVGRYVTEKGPHRAHFRRGRNAAHEQRCRYNVPQRVEKLLAEGLTQKRQKVYRIVLPETLLRRPPPPAASGNEQHYLEQLTRLVNSAAIVADLLELFEQDKHGSDLAAQFELRCRDQPVEWLNFCYSRRRSTTLARRLRTNEQQGTELPHPVAMVIAMHDLRQTRSRPLLRGQGHRDPVEIDPDETGQPSRFWRLAFGLWLDDPDYADGYQPGDRIIAFGVPWLYYDHDRRRLYLNMQITHPRQIAPYPPD